MKLAYFVLPHIGGTYSVFKRLRSGLRAYGIDVQWFGVCSEKHTVPPGMEDDLSFGVMMPMPDTLGEGNRAKQVLAKIRNEGFDGIIVNVLGDRLQTNIIRYLPEDLLRIVVVHNISPGTYAAARSIRDYTHLTIGVSERCRADLVHRFGFPRERTYAIPNAVDTEAFQLLARKRNRAGPAIRALFAGRIEDSSKGVLWLPEILDGLPASITLTVVGDGPDLPKLRRRLAGYAQRVSFAGAVQPAEIPQVMTEHDVLIMPSRFEGLGLTLIEAMAGGCVPVVSHIRGVTDTVVEHDTNGILFPVGNYTAAANAIVRLDAERDLLERMSVLAREMIPKRFSIETMAGQYHDVIRAAENGDTRLAPMLDIDSWSLPSGLRRGLRSYVPLPLKNWLRVVRERV